VPEECSGSTRASRRIVRDILSPYSSSNAQASFTEDGCSEPESDTGDTVSGILADDEWFPEEMQDQDIQSGSASQLPDFAK